MELEIFLLAQKSEIPFPNESYQDLLERYNKPVLLMIYLIFTHNYWKLTEKKLLCIFQQFLAAVLTPNFCQMLLK